MSNYASFHGRCIDWLRNDRSLRTAVLPENKLSDRPDEVVRLDGFFARPSAAGSWALAGLAGLLLSTVLSGLSQGLLAGQLGAFAAQGGNVILAVSALCLLGAEVQRRRNRVRGTVELRAKDCPPATRQSVESLRREAPLGAAWIISELELSPETLKRAAQLGVRCFVSQAKRVEERSVFLMAQREAAAPIARTSDVG